MITITRWFTFCESWAASAGVIGCSALLRATAAAGAAVAADAVADDSNAMTGTDAAATTSDRFLILDRASGTATGLGTRILSLILDERPKRPRAERFLAAGRGPATLAGPASARDPATFVRA